MKKSEAKAKRLAGLRQWRKRIEGSPLQLREEETNRLIARRLRELRTLRGMTLMELGAASGVSYQGFQKYEKVVTAIDAARLETIAEALGVPIGYFFDARAATTLDDELQDDILRLARKLKQIERGSPGGFRKLRDLINALSKNKE